MLCENCKIECNTHYGSGRFCSVKCARGFSTLNKRKEINEKVSSKLTGRMLTAEHIKSIEIATNFNRKEKIIKNCLLCKSEIHCSPCTTRRKFCNSLCWARYTELNKNDFELYRKQCGFDFSINDYPDKFDLDLIKKHGLYSPSNKGNNLNGISKDHMISVREGYENNIDPSIIKHPANCKLLPHKENQKKHKKSCITLEQLLERIKYW
jgi:hypothetical protein